MYRVRSAGRGSRSSSGNSTRSVPYDYNLNLPENKTVAQLKQDLTDRGVDIPKQAKKVHLIKLWKESQSATTVTRRGRQSFPRHLNNAQSRDPDADDPEVSNQNTHNASNNNNGDLHAAIVSLTATVQSLSEKVSSLEERDRRMLSNSQEGRSSVDHCYSR